MGKVTKSLYGNCDYFWGMNICNLFSPQREREMYRMLLKIRDRTNPEKNNPITPITFNEAVNWGYSSDKMMQTLRVKGLINLIQRDENEYHSYFIKSEGEDFIDNFEKGRNKRIWDAIKFFSGYVSGVISAITVWYFTHKCP
jgi:predicted transcriptional regulator